MAQYFWQETENDRVRIGLTEGAQEAFGKIKFAKLPAVGETVTVGNAFLSVEAEKAVLDLDAPLSGQVVAVNEAANATPALLDDPERKNNWIAEIKA
ncbi:glycine cleavage system protein H [Lacticaseibacillus mingshuiensis]|uniref:Glycine cleavage system protein H n=1 Tax=Lacticaseibacillus mingshuiensis TaxID=2799574 RepID=A0ABW4CJE2_9LACO|nr:glycine cleavage system protein H [Lacticaseibacillus mingshuiensis]